MGQALRGSAEDGRGRRGAVTERGRRLAARALLILATCSLTLPGQDAPGQLLRGRFTVRFFEQDRLLAASLAAHAVATDTFPGLARPQQRVTIAIAPDARTFRDWAGGAPEWGSAVAFPESRRVVLQGRRAGSDAGDPLVVLRHELAHLALHEQLGNLPPRWFDEGYASFAAGEWGREEILRTNVAIALRGVPTLDELEASFGGGTVAAQSAYALAYRAVADLAGQDRGRGLALFFQYWASTRSLERALRQAYGLTLAGFEAQWSRRIRAQYGVLALLGNLTIAAFVFLVILAPAYIARRRRDRKRLQKMRESEAAAEEAARQSALNELLGEEPR